MKKIKNIGIGAGIVALAAAIATPAWLLILAMKHEDKLLGKSEDTNEETKNLKGAVQKEK